MKKLKIGFRQGACAGGRRSPAPAPVRWNARSARVFGCGFRKVMRGLSRFNFSQLQEFREIEHIHARHNNLGAKGS